jgi:exonuclease SbcC
MIIHRLKASAFQIVGDPISLEFPEEGKIGILGQNESGKTTLLEVIEYALYGVRRGRGADESRENIVTWGKEEAKLEIEFTSGQDSFLLRRAFDVRGGHKARLTPLVNGKEDLTKALNSLTEIEARIEQITGMDRDSFTKLVYIRQKDLDALKELAKARREQLVNKVMGIEVFDDAIGKVKDDLSTLEKDLEKRRIELESVQKNAQTYQQRLAEKDKLQTEITAQKSQLEKKDSELKEAEKVLQGYDWLSSFDSTRKLISSAKEQRSRVQQDIIAMGELEGQVQKYQAVLEKHKPEFNRLEGLKASFLAAESNLEHSRNNLQSLQERENRAVAGAGLTDKERAILSQDLPTKKQHELVFFVLSLVLCVSIIAVSGLLQQLLLNLLALAFGALSIWFFLAYQRTDKILSSSAEIQTLHSQITDAAAKVQDAQRVLDTLAVQSNVKNVEGINLALSEINSSIRLETGQESIQAVEALKESSLHRLRQLKESAPNAKLAELDRQLQERTSELEKMEITRPESTASLQYDSGLHQNAKSRVDALRREFGQLDGELQRKIGTLSQIEVDLERLVGDFNRCPELEEKYKTREHEREILDLVVSELGETSRAMRGQVIPHASFIINQILPTLTDGRYSQFEITEDLRFKAYSTEAGGYKEREIFSGGTQDQFLIALRLAFTQSILDSRVMADRYCLLMDECISSSDEQRKQGIFEVLDAMKKTFSQILIIAHEDISSFVDNHIVLGRNQRGYTEIQSKSW